jgi:hypothetical protein
LSRPRIRFVILFFSSGASCGFPLASGERVTFFARAKKVTKESTSEQSIPREELHDDAAEG